MKNHELKNLTDYSTEDKPWDERRSFICVLPDLSTTANVSGLVVVFCGLGGQQTQRPEKRVCGCVMRGSVVSGTVLSASGGDP